MKKIVILISLFFSAVAHSAPPILGNLNANPYDQNSVSNPYGEFGSPCSQDSINNPYATNPPVIFYPDEYDY